MRSIKNESVDFTSYGGVSHDFNVTKIDWSFVPSADRLVSIKFILSLVKAIMLDIVHCIIWSDRHTLSYVNI